MPSSVVISRCSTNKGAPRGGQAGRHLKDIRAQGEHDTCQFGDGVVPVEDCVRALTEIGYTDPISIEHEPYSYDPASEIVVFREMLASWLGEPAG